MGFLMARFGAQTAFRLSSGLALAAAALLVGWSLVRRYTSK